MHKLLKFPFIPTVLMGSLLLVAFQSANPPRKVVLQLSEAQVQQVLNALGDGKLKDNLDTYLYIYQEAVKQLNDTTGRK